MNLDKSLSKILIIDFGSQFTQLIARRIRELGVFSEILSHKKVKIKDIDNSVKGIILSGGPLNVYENKRYAFDKRIIKKNIPYLVFVLDIKFSQKLMEVKKNNLKVVSLDWQIFLKEMRVY